jgi:RimJ/RimL family protein N-acetyltransferase
MDNGKIFYDTFISGSHVDLVVLTEEIARDSDWYKWFNDQENMKNMQKHYFPNTRSDQVEFFKGKISGSKTHLQLGVFHKKDEILIGMVSLSNIDYLNRKCEFSAFIGEKQYQNIKNFVEASRLLLRHAFMELNLNRVYGGTIIKNLLEFLVRVIGFKHEGVRKEDVFKNGCYHDVYLVGILRSDYIKRYH